jgi:hypothetical protein
VRAGPERGHQDVQIPWSEKPLKGKGSRRLGRTRDKAQVSALCETAEVLDANACETCDFLVGEDLLTRFDADQSRNLSREFALSKTSALEIPFLTARTART